MSSSSLNFEALNKTVHKVKREVQSLPLWIQLFFLAASLFAVFSEIVVSMMRSP